MKFHKMKNLLLILFVLLLGCSLKTAEDYIKKGDRQSKFSEKEIYYVEALKLEAKNIKALNRIGYLHMYFDTPKDLEKARSTFVKVLEIDSSNNDALFGMGETYKTHGIRNDSVFGNIIDTAIIYYSKVIEKYPEDTRSLYQRGYCYHYLSDSIHSYTDFHRACDLGDVTACQMIKFEQN